MWHFHVRQNFYDPIKSRTENEESQGLAITKLSEMSLRLWPILFKNRYIKFFLEEVAVY